MNARKFMKKNYFIAKFVINISLKRHQRHDIIMKFMRRNDLIVKILHFRKIIKGS